MSDYNEQTSYDKNLIAQGLINELKVSYPRVANSLELFWGHYEFIDYLDSIMISDTNDRQGFDPAAFVILWKLHNLAQ
jgi:hypothetical protein